MISAPVGVLPGPEDRPGRSRGLPDASRTLHVPKTLEFLWFLCSEELLSKLSEISHRLPRNGQNVCISLEIVMVWAIMCSRLQPQPHYARGTVQNHTTDHPTCFSPLLLRVCVKQARSSASFYVVTIVRGTDSRDFGLIMRWLWHDRLRS